MAPPAPDRPARRWPRRLALASALVLIVVVTGLALLPELRLAALLAVSPRTGRDACVVRLQQRGVTVTLLGTLHGGHLDTPAYGLPHLKAALVHLAPDRVLVEQRPDELARGRWGDGPLEMPFVALWARHLALAVDGIDWWRPRGDTARRTDAERDDRLFQNLVERLPPAGTALVVVGFSHVPELAERLTAAGFVPVAMTSEAKAALFEPDPGPLAFPPGMAAAIRQRIDDTEAELATATGREHDDLAAVLASRRAYLQLIERTGEVSEGR
jgi:hypothetical protein